MLIHLNGLLLKEKEAVVSVFDRGFLFGDGVFESMRAYGGRVFRLARHLERLRRSAHLVSLEGAPEGDALAAAISELLAINGLSDARLRLTLTRGRGRPGDYVATLGPPTVVISAAPFSGLDARHFSEGVVLHRLSRPSVPAATLDPAIKSTSRIVSVLARREAGERGAFEAVLLDSSGNVSEGTASNVLITEGDRLITPAAPGSTLPGVTREAVLEVGRLAGLRVSEEPLASRRLDQADEVLLTNTSWEVLPVVRLDDHRVGAGQPGPIGRDLLSRYRALVRQECSDVAR